MKYTINGFSQEVLVRLGLDIIDASIIQWFSDFHGTGRMRAVKDPEGEGDYFWVQYQKVISDLPCLGITNKRVIARRFQKLCSSGILEFLLKKREGNYSCYRKGKTFISLMYAPQSTEGSTVGYIGLDPKVRTKDSSINSSIKYKERFTLSAEEPDEESGPEPDYSALFAEALRPKEAL